MGEGYRVVIFGGGAVCDFGWALAGCDAIQALTTGLFFRVFGIGESAHY
jgi:hypothetical protein